MRELARVVGMTLADQARISLAASSVAKAVEFGGARPGQVTMDDCCRDGRTGVRVVCTAKNGKLDRTPNALGDARWMVDELSFETPSSNEFKVTLVKWRT